MENKRVSLAKSLFWMSLSNILFPGFLIFVSLFILFPIGISDAGGIRGLSYLLSSYMPYANEIKSILLSGFVLFGIGLLFNITISIASLVVVLVLKTKTYFKLKIANIIFLAMFYVLLFVWIGMILNIILSLLILKNENSIKKETIFEEKKQQKESFENLQNFFEIDNTTFN